jgi:hypothetical protein
MRLCFKFTWLKIMIDDAFLSILNEPSSSVKYWNFLCYSSPEELRSMELIPKSCQTTTSEIVYLRIQESCAPLSLVKQSRIYISISSNKMQQYAGIYLLQNHSTCFGCPSHPSSGVHKTLTATSGTGHSI